jgi:hypothetical protein
MADEIVLMQALHDEDNPAVLLVVEAAIERIVIPLIDLVSLSLGNGLVRLEGIVDDEQVGAAAGQHAADGGGKPMALGRSHELLHRLLVC